MTPTLETYALPDLIAHYGGVEKDVNVACRNCGGNTPHDCRPSYLQTPRILVIQALRFVVPKSPTLELASTIDIESSTGTESPPTDSETSISNTKRRAKKVAKRKVLKNASNITFPLEGLDMTPYLRAENPDPELYDLFGVVEHVGRRMDGGHYLAYVRGKNENGMDAWWKCNDGKCWMVNPDSLSAVQGYIWFYERRTQRGNVPEDWDVQIDQGLATPESYERDVRDIVIQRDTQMEQLEENELEESWQGRLRTSTTDGTVSYFH
jgi:ubiquitin C-terminal hydrolase